MSAPDPFAALRLDGRIIIVTGSTQGIGGAIALRAAELGAAGIVLCGRDERRGAEQRERVEALGAHAELVIGELAEESTCRRIIAAADRAFGRVDGLVNAAGLSTRGTLAATSVALWDHLFAVNVRAPFILMQDAAAIMRRERRGGAIVSIISMSAHGGVPELTPYAASKAALAGLTRNAGHALQPDRIRVNGLNIGWTSSEGEHAVQLGEGQPQDWLAHEGARQPFGRLLDPVADIAPIACHLLSDAAAMVTGSVIDWDQTVNGALGEHVPQVGAQTP